VDNVGCVVSCDDESRVFGCRAGNNVFSDVLSDALGKKFQKVTEVAKDGEGRCDSQKAGSESDVSGGQEHVKAGNEKGVFGIVR
jgi:hypothetical protein